MKNINTLVKDIYKLFDLDPIEKDEKKVEKNEEKAKEFSGKLSNTLMLSGDCLDVDFLESENISSLYSY